MLFLQVDKENSSKYIYQQIYEEIKNLILDHKLQYKERLPSKRKLADQLNISINSVSNAYEQLLAEGYIYSVERKGYYVENITQFINREGLMNRPLPNDLKESGFNNKEGWLSFSHMRSDVTLFPYKEWEKCQNLVFKNHKEELSQVSHPQGPYMVRKTISDMIALTRGVKCEPEQIIIGTGTQALIRQLLNTQSINVKIAIEDPGYIVIYRLLKSMNLNIIPIKLDKKGMNIKEVEIYKPNFLFITPSHQFPTGIIMPVSRRVELLNWAALSNDRYIIEDDYDSEFKYGTDNIPSLQGLDKNGRVIYVGTFSKSLLPSLRISYMVLPTNLLREYRKKYNDFIQESNSFSLFTLHYFIKSGEYAKHIKRMNNFYEKKRKRLIAQLHLQFKNNICIKNVPAGLHFIAQFKTTRSYEEIEQRAIDEKLEVYSLRRYMLHNNYIKKNNIELVIGYASINEVDIKEAVSRLYRVIYK